jgi:hypothetical protein
MALYKFFYVRAAEPTRDVRTHLSDKPEVRDKALCPDDNAQLCEDWPTGFPGGRRAAQRQ